MSGDRSNKRFLKASSILSKARLLLPSFPSKRDLKGITLADLPGKAPLRMSSVDRDKNPFSLIEKKNS
jgi:hypothetical protein